MFPQKLTGNFSKKDPWFCHKQDILFVRGIEIFKNKFGIRIGQTSRVPLKDLHDLGVWAPFLRVLWTLFWLEYLAFYLSFFFWDLDKTTSKSGLIVEVPSGGILSSSNSSSTKSSPNFDAIRRSLTTLSWKGETVFSMGMGEFIKDRGICCWGYLRNMRYSKVIIDRLNKFFCRSLYNWLWMFCVPGDILGGIYNILKRWGWRRFSEDRLYYNNIQFSSILFSVFLTLVGMSFNNIIWRGKYNLTIGD